ncbi:MAG TPA: ABC transporter permease [Acidimicrobiales bacterium]|nr:ABC transporter permease [Acidimicrobiales bacterium]
MEGTAESTPLAGPSAGAPSAGTPFAGAVEPGLDKPPLASPVLAGTAPEGGDAHETGSMLRLTVRAFLENKLAVLGLAMFLLMVLFSFVGPMIYVTNQTNTAQAILNGLPNSSPSGGHILGTDNEAFDILGRLMVAGQSSIEIGLAAGFFAAIVGTIYGAVSAVVGGAVDAVMMRIVDALYALPTLFLLIVLASMFNPSLLLLILVFSFISWTPTARLVRGEALSLRTREYVQAVTVAGGTRARIVLRHIVPNTIGTIMVNTSFLVADAIIAVATLSFLGLGLPNTIPSWGAMLTVGVDNLANGYWWELYPAGICIVLSVVAFNFIGDALRDSLDVRLQKR